MRIWPWRWHHGNSMKFQGLKSKAMAEVKSNHHPKPTKPCKIPWDHFKMYGKVDHKMCTAPQRQALFSKTCSTASTVSHPPGCFWNILLCPGVVSFKGGTLNMFLYQPVSCRRNPHSTVPCWKKEGVDDSLLQDAVRSKINGQVEYVHSAGWTAVGFE